MAQARSFNSAIIRFVGLVLMAGALLSPTAFAQSGWRLCNETSFVLEAATGKPEGQSSVVVDGWTRLRPGECRVAMAPPLKPGAHFVFARSSAAHRGGLRVWSGDVPLCVDIAGSFSVQSPISCASMGLESRNFRSVRIDKRNTWTTKFLETEPYGEKRAQAAGLQRLLNDAGVEEARIDGYIGRRTRAGIARFLNSNGLPAQTSDADLIDYLEEVARARSRNVGLTLCNRSDAKVWAAIARRRGDGWESRGWWSIEGGACARAIDESLISTPHYIFAEMETPAGFRTLLGANELFCISRSKFAILGREGCEVRAYREEEFVETNAPEDGKLVYEFFERDFGPVGGLGGALGGSAGVVDGAP